MPDTSALDAAVIARLTNDATLAGLMPDGVYFDVAASGKTRFVIVSQVTHDDNDDVFGSPTAWEEAQYLVKAVALNTTGADVKTAAARIQTLLQDAALTVTGYSLMHLRRSERVRYTEVDPENDARWQHRGGIYDAWVTPT